jgi:hypothetical protein
LLTEHEVYPAPTLFTMADYHCACIDLIMVALSCDVLARA